MPEENMIEELVHPVEDNSGFPSTPAPEPAPEPVPEPAPEPVPEPAPEPVPEPAPEPAPQPEVAVPNLVDSIHDVNGESFLKAVSIVRRRHNLHSMTVDEVKEKVLNDANLMQECKEIIKARNL